MHNMMADGPHGHSQELSWGRDQSRRSGQWLQRDAPKVPYRIHLPFTGKAYSHPRSIPHKVSGGYLLLLAVSYVSRSSL